MEMYCYVSESQLAGKTDEEIEMMKHMGFCGFDTTKVRRAPFPAFSHPVNECSDRGTALRVWVELHVLHGFGANGEVAGKHCD